MREAEEMLKEDEEFEKSKSKKQNEVILKAFKAQLNEEKLEAEARAHEEKENYIRKIKMSLQRERDSEENQIKEMHAAEMER